MNEEKDDLILRVFGEDGELDIDKPDEGLAEYKQRKKEARDRMIALQRQPYEVKVARSKLRAYANTRADIKQMNHAHTVPRMRRITMSQ